MQTAATTHLAGQGWQSPLPAALDSPQTLVLAFGASQLGADAPALQDLAAAFPRSVLLGCSTAGEIAGDAVNDGSLSVAVTRFDHTRLVLAVADVAQASQSGDAGDRKSVV